MNEKEFWQITDMLDWDKSGDDEAVVQPAVEYLTQKDDEDIYRFEDMLAEKLYALDTRANADEFKKENDFSDDGFLYARCIMLVNGKEYYEKVLKNPKEFPKDLDFESILFIAQDAYEAKNDKDWEYFSPIDYESCSNKEGWR